MNPSCHKFYHEHGFDSREHLETYFTNNTKEDFEDDLLKFPMKTLHCIFSEGKIKGDLLIDISNGAFIHHIYSASGCFKKICVLKCAEKCIMELNKWINTRTGAFDWSHIFAYTKVPEGDRDKCEVKDIPLKEAIAEIVKCDVDKENFPDPVVLRTADCVISVWLLELISKDQDDYIKYFRKFLKLLKPKGFLILVGSLNTTYMIIGQDKIHVLKYDEKFLKQVLADEGFIIDHWAVQSKTAVSDVCNYNAIVVVAAHREN